MQVDGAVRCELTEVIGATVVLIDKDRVAVHHDQCRVAARTISN